MNYFRIIARFLGLTLALFALAAAGSVTAQIPESKEAFVYGINATMPGEVFGTFSPPSVEDIYILAGRVSILSPRRTQVFFWPITKKYVADWSQLNEPLDGVLEIMQHNRVIGMVTNEPYTVHFEAAGTTKGQIYVGTDALVADAQFLELRESYQQAVHDYRLAREEWLEVRSEPQETSQAKLASEPQPPPNFNVHSVGLHQGFPIELESGVYQIHMRQPDGQVVDGSQRTLRVFERRQSAIGYEVIPEERWTFPEQVNAETDVILAKRGSVIYLKPRVVHEYPALAYERLKDAQHTGKAIAEWRWVVEVGAEAFADSMLEIVRGGVVAERVAKKSYFVSQAFDLELGYQILPFDPETPDLTPRVDFEGYRIQLQQGRDSFAVRLEPQAGVPYANSTRHVRVMPDSILSTLAPTPFLAAAFGLLLFILRRSFHLRIGWHRFLIRPRPG